ncbi:MAG: glutathione S-transferase family protein, partial [Hyphomicrobiaceae bacterium]
RLYGMAFEHRPWSVFGDADKIRALNPLVRVPTLVLGDGEVLIESGAILDHLDASAGPERTLMPREGVARRRALKTVSLAMGLADKAVALFYERRLHDKVSDVWSTRCRQQILGVAAALDQERAASQHPYWHGEQLGHADIAAAVALRFASEAHPGLIDRANCPALTTHAARLEAMPVFQEIAQAFVPPA